MEKQINEEMLAALKAFVAQANKLSGFPAQYAPYVGAITLARAAIARATAEQSA